MLRTCLIFTFSRSSWLSRTRRFMISADPLSSVRGNHFANSSKFPRNFQPKPSSRETSMDGDRNMSLWPGCVEDWKLQDTTYPAKFFMKSKHACFNFSACSDMKSQFTKYQHRSKLFLMCRKLEGLPDGKGTHRRIDELVVKVRCELNQRKTDSTSSSSQSPSDSEMESTCDSEGQDF